MKTLILDNYDSFTYNLVQIIERILQEKVFIKRNDEISLDEIQQYSKIVLSPGPGIPSEAGILLDLIKRYAPYKSILGVCLGQQAICESFGGKLINLSNIYHGVGSNIIIQKPDCQLLQNLPNPFVAGRYHSWAVSNEDFPKELDITAVDENGIIMSIQHREYDVHAVQFHPESILTPDGEQLIRNFFFP